MNSKLITTLEALLEYAHRLPWSVVDNITAYKHLGAALEGIDEDNVNVPSPG